MSVPSMVHRSGDSLVVRSVISGDTLFGEPDELDEKDLPECKIKRNYSCASCDYFTQNPRHFLYHLRDVHKEKVRIYECPNCLYASKHFQKLLRHTKMVHGSTNGVEMPEFTRAKTRKRPAPDDEDLEADTEPDEDLLDDGDKTILKCSLCAFTTRNQIVLGKHEAEAHIKTKFFRCTKCTYVTHMKARFTKHVKYHSMPMIKCDLCDFRTPYKWNLDRHCKNHNGRGAFRCSACNFTADIKQSLTVHEMNHHVPPVGQAAGLGVGRRRNKVGASDSTAEELAQVGQTETSCASVDDDSRRSHKTKFSGKKLKIGSCHEQSSRAYGSDFINPDDIIHHANGNIYIKNKCKLCNYKSAWDGEMAKHEQKVHNIMRKEQAKPIKKPSRPIPNLIPIPSQTSVLKVTPRQPVLKSPEIEQTVMSQKDINAIVAKSSNSSLKDFASLFGSEDVFKDVIKPTDPVPDLIPAAKFNKITKPSPKNQSLFYQLQEKLMNSGESCNLTCQYCGHESKCLTESATHLKICGKEQTLTLHSIPVHNLSSTRCQHCRQRCKSSTDLYNHLQTCKDALKAMQEEEEEEEEEEDKEDVDKVEENNEPHPMENRVFVWNNIEVPMDIEVEDSPHTYEYVDDKQEDNVSLISSFRTQSPGSENSYFGTEVVHNTSTVTDKIPTHGTDISVAQHKRVFKCPHCSFWASTASRFHVHIVGHLNKKPFECSLCAYRSNWRWDITKHIKLKSVRDPAHEDAKVLMTDETGRRNYTKYNKYLTEIHLSGEHSETSGGSGTRPKINYDFSSPSQTIPSKSELPKLTRAPSSNDFSPLLKNASLRPLPALKAADSAFFAKKRANADSKKTLWKCKKCNFRDASRDKLLAHVKGHYQQAGASSILLGQGTSSSMQITDNDEASSSGAPPRGQAPFRCGHCHQVSNWKHVIQRHCRLKHSGDIRVVIGTKNGPEKIEIEEQLEEPDHIDVAQVGTFKCKICPFSNNDHDEFEQHLEHHRGDNLIKCNYCGFSVSHKEDLYEHLKLHGIKEPDEYFSRFVEKNPAEGDKRHKCNNCPYVTNSKSQYLYHKQFHKPRGGQYSCSHCGYNVSKRHLLHQHLKVHGINMSPQKPTEVIDLDEIKDEIEEVPNINLDQQNFPDIPLVWVSKNGKFFKMYKCRFCPHVNLRKVNIQEHEKMHGVREKNPNANRGNDVEHHCPECNYVCNNAGVLSSHSKVHQGSYGTIHCLVDTSKTDEEQISELGRFLKLQTTQDSFNLEDEIENETSLIDDESESILYFCERCPARFLKETEHAIHTGFHGKRLFYKCDYCSYTARQTPHLLAHNKVHTDEYQERTKILQKVYSTSPLHKPSQTCIKTNQNGDFVWVVDETNDDIEMDTSSIVVSKPYRSSQTVPISGTDLYLQKEEAQLKHASEKVIIRPNDHFPPAPPHVDPQFGTLMLGNPKFIYPTYLKNGRMKEKRYKCHKCPSAFEKREQYKVHLSLHGSKQRYRCDHCDYSVKYYANYVQHLKKHQMNLDAQAARKSGDFSEECDEVDEFEEPPTEQKAAKNISPKNGSSELSLCEKQSVMITQRRRSESVSKEIGDDKKLFWCPNCPYTNHRKDAVDNHQKRHISVSGSTGNYTCDHCDYSVPQVHFLRDHIKLHFQTNKTNQLDGYMICDNLQLKIKPTAAAAADDDEVDDDLDEELKGDETSTDETLLFKDIGSETPDRFLPVLDEETLQRLNNNDGERIVMNASGELIDNKVKLDDCEEVVEENASNSQIISDN